MKKKAKTASSNGATEQDEGEAMDSEAVREQPNQGDELLLALGSDLEKGLRLKKRKYDKNQGNIHNFFGGEEAVPLPTLESLREIRNALRRVSDRVDLAIRDAEQQQVLTHASQARQDATVDHGTLTLPGFGLTGDLLERVLQQLSTKDLVRLGIVCKSWREVMARPEVHREFNVSEKLNRITKLYEVLKQPRFRLLQSFTVPRKTPMSNKFFSKLAGFCPCLTKLDLTKVKNMDGDKMRHLVSSFTHLRELVVSEIGSYLGDYPGGDKSKGLLHGLTCVVRANKQLESLEYTNSWIYAGHISSEFMHAIGALPHLKTVSLTGPTFYRTEDCTFPDNRWSNITLEDVLDLLRACPNLEKVALRNFPTVHTELLTMGVTLQEAASEIISPKCSLLFGGELADVPGNERP